jgi:L-alanine-DL-glutamate epimerase-like enolase superfamily enzyme
MKITSIEVIALEKDPGCLSRPVLCRIYTDAGITGLGEAGVAIGTGSPAAFQQIEDLCPMIIPGKRAGNAQNWEYFYEYVKDGGAL